MSNTKNLQFSIFRIQFLLSLIKMIEGKIVQIIGPVVDVEFPDVKNIPGILEALTIQKGDTHIVLESNASEHSARRIAMKNASDNAKELTDELTTIYNRVRQEKITNEILEITGGAKALAG